jgi:thiol-disulfide isomerase/thioredoxin
MIVMSFLSCHPPLDELSDFLAHSGGNADARVAAHLERCQACRDSLRFLRGVDGATRDTHIPGPSPTLRARVLASRTAGVRTILPIADAIVPATRKWRLSAAAAVLLAALIGTLATRNAREVEASTTSGTLIFMPAAPRPGQPVSVSYRPSGMLSRQPWLTLRSRLRAPGDESYNDGIPITTVAVLQRNADGDFTGRFVLPDSVVYAVFAVEDSSAGVVDDNTGRDWELLVSDSTGKPRFEALSQRANDMMGRNWEEGFATARQMVALYPTDLRAWNWMHAFDAWLGRTGVDSVRSIHRSTLAAFDSALTSKPGPSSEEIGELAWYANSVDSAVAARWRARLLREAPTNSFSIQWRLMAVLDSLRIRKDTTQALERMDALWKYAPAGRRAQIANYATDIALSTGATDPVKLWIARLRQGRDRRSVARRAATQLARTPAFRADGIRSLRAELDSVTRMSPADRALGETLSEQRDRHAATRRQLLATLGQALVAAGNYTEGRAALVEAASVGWNLNVLRAVQRASMAAGDTARALTMAARVAVDPRTPRAFTDSVQLLAHRVLGAAAWRSELDSARAEFVGRMLADARARSLSGEPRVRDMDGRTHSLRELMKGRVTVVAFWSRFCGPAIEDLPRLNAVAARLEREGVRVVSIIDEPAASDALKTFLREHRVTVPTQLDAWHESSRAFNQWATPSYYVLDSDGRVRFAVTNSADEALARAEALRLSETPAR